MKNKLFLLLLIAICSSCGFLKDTLDYRAKTEVFIENLLSEDYDKCLESMALEHELAASLDVDTLRNGLVNIRSSIANNFGTDLDYTLIRAEKTLVSTAENAMPPNLTVLLLEIKNKSEFGVFRAVFDDASKKVLHVRILNIKKPIPNMLSFWLFGILALAVLAFNVYVIVQIYKSTLKRKWLKYLMVLILNVPTLSYAATEGFSFELLSFQFLFGVSLSLMGYMGSVLAFGIPLGGLYWFWKLKFARQRSEDEMDDEIDRDDIIDVE